MDNNKLAWNDLRYVVAISPCGSAAAAARDLGVSHTTVLRRILALEQSMGTPLFYRRATGDEPTEAGRQLIEACSLMETRVLNTQRAIEGRADLNGGGWAADPRHLRHTRRIDVYIEHVAHALRAALLGGPGGRRRVTEA